MPVSLPSLPSTRALPAILLAASWACTAPTTPAPDPGQADLTLAFGGDVILGRRLNRILHDPAPQPWGPVRSTLRDADITLLNAEGVISAGGMYFDKGDTRPYEYRAHPGAVPMFLDGGVDVLAVGNNHTMDYGPDALVEMLDRLDQAGIGAAGAGETAADAATPVYIDRDGLVVAFVGMNLTGSSWIWADDDHPGVHGAKPDDDDLVQRLADILTTARSRAHLVFFTPHWGPNGETAPSEATRALARELIEAGYDGIFGHSAHVLQGVEIIDGKPVLYDGGNMLWDRPEGATLGQAMHFLMTFDEGGVHTVRGVPQLLGANELVAPSAEDAAEILQLWSERSAALGTAVTADGLVHCTPGDPHEPWLPVPLPEPIAAVREAPSRAFPEGLPADADTTIVATWPDLGVELVAGHLLAPELTERGAQWVTTWWRRLPDGPTPPDDLEIGTAWTGEQGVGSESHLPADWMELAPSWPEGALIRDEQLVRIDQDPGGWVDFDVFLRRGASGPELPPEGAEGVGSARVDLGSAVYTDDAPRVLSREPLP